MDISNETKTEALKLQAKLSTVLHTEAKARDYLLSDAIMVEALNSFGDTYTAKWLDDAEFIATFKGNMVGYYLGICVNCLCGGLVSADSWANDENSLQDIEYADIYDGGVWNNIFVLMEMTNDSDKKDFQNFILELYEKWVVMLKDYFDMPSAKEYILKSISSFFMLGVSLRLDILGY